MDDAPRAPLVLLQGGRTGEDEDETPAPLLGREDLRVIPGGPDSDVYAAIEEAVLAARRMRAEIEERIARALEEKFQ
jgi:hypothetical protein